MANTRGPSIDEAAIAKILKSGTAQQLHNERARLIELKKSVEDQLANDRADQRDVIAGSLNAGVDYDTATRQVFMESDHDWRARASSLIRLADKMIGKINARLHEMGGGGHRRSAAVIAGAGTTAAQAAEALNIVLQRGCMVLAFAAVNGDLIVIATEPKDG